MHVGTQRLFTRDAGHILSKLLNAIAFLTADAAVPAAIRTWLFKFQKAAFEQQDISWQQFKAKGKWLVWGEIIGVVRLQRELYESWESQKYAVLLLYCSIPPAWGCKHSELKLYVTNGDLQLWELQVRHSNCLLLATDHSRS